MLGSIAPTTVGMSPRANASYKLWTRATFCCDIHFSPLCIFSQGSLLYPSECSHGRFSHAYRNGFIPTHNSVILVLNTMTKESLVVFDAQESLNHSKARKREVLGK